MSKKKGKANVESDSTNSIFKAADSSKGRQKKRYREEGRGSKEGGETE